MINEVSLELGGRRLTIEHGRWAEQANGAVVLRYGDTVLLATACASKDAREGVDFLPLTVDVAEKFYAIGKLPGGFFKREARPSSDAILAARLCDRPLRPLFPKNYHNDTQVIVSVMSSDPLAPYQALSIIAASAALTVSDIPFDDTISACVIGLTESGELQVNPSYEELVDNDLELTVAGDAETIMMVEAGAKFVSEELLLDALNLARETNGEVVKLIRDIQKKIGKPKWSVPDLNETQVALRDKLSECVGKRFDDVLHEGGDKQGRIAAISEIKQEAMGLLDEGDDKIFAKSVLGDLEKVAVRKAILDDGIRPDGRKADEIRPLSSEVSVLPRVHGTGVFKRGETQILNAVTLAPPSEAQRLDGFGSEDKKHFIHHYNFPPYSTGEAGRFGFTSRREVGHGALAERALKPVVPVQSEFPYVIRSVSEALSSNGSTSMASVCAGTLALMDAGVPIKAPVAGIAMGLISGADGKYAILTDIQGAEDHCGDMDFKVAGTRDGVTALQMDIKIKGISFEVMQIALEQAKQARLTIMDQIESTLDQPRSEVSKYAPRIHKTSIPVDKIGALIGPGGANIRKLTEEFEVSIDIEEDGTVLIGATSEEAARRAIESIESMTREVELGQVFTGKVTRLMDFGAFVQVSGGKDGLVHISELAENRVADVESVVQVGDELEVMVVNKDPMGRIDLSARAVLEGKSYEEMDKTRFTRSRGGGGGDRRGGGRRPGGFDDRRSGGGGSGRRFDDRRSGGGDDRRRSGGYEGGGDRRRSGGYEGGGDRRRSGGYEGGGGGDDRRRRPIGGSGRS